MTTTSFSADEVDPQAWRDLLLRQWMTHDAMWFGQTVLRQGIDVANDLNCAAVRAMAAVETTRVCRLAAIDQVSTPAQLRRFFDAAVALVIPRFMTFEMTWADGDTRLTFHITRCFAHDGVAGLGLLEQYRCGIYERVYGWLDALGVTYETLPATSGCLRAGGDACRRTFAFEFPVPPGVADAAS